MKRIILFLIITASFMPVFAEASVIAALKKYSSAIKLVNEGKSDQAITLLQEVINENSKLTYANVLLGICYYNKGDYLKGATEIGKFIDDEKNAQDGSDKYPLALVYYLRCQHKINNLQAVQSHYLFVDKYPIPNIAGQLFTAETLVDASSNSTFPTELKKELCDKGIEILEKSKNDANKMIWFNNTYGRALIIEQSLEKDEDSKIKDLINASKYFEIEKTVNDRTTVSLNLAVSYRLIGENYIIKFWKIFSEYKKQSDLKEHYPELKDLINTALKFNQKCSDEIERSKMLPGNEVQKVRIKNLEDITKQETNSINSDPTMNKILYSSKAP